MSAMNGGLPWIRGGLCVIADGLVLEVKGGGWW